MGAKLLQDVRQDLADVVQVCEGKKKQTNYLRTLINELVKGRLPGSWVSPLGPGPATRPRTASPCTGFSSRSGVPSWGSRREGGLEELVFLLCCSVEYLLKSLRDFYSI